MSVNHNLKNVKPVHKLYTKEMRGLEDYMLRVYKVSPEHVAIQLRMDKSYTHCNLNIAQLDILIEKLMDLRTEFDF